MSQETQLLITILSSSGILSFIGFMLRKRIILEVENSIKNKYDVKLENLKGELNVSHSILANSLLNQSEGLKVVNEKRISAIENYWNLILEFEPIIDSVKLMDTLFLIEEFETINKTKQYSDAKFKETIDYTFCNIDTKRLVESVGSTKQLEKLRPFIGEELWLLKFYYDQLIGRILTFYKSTYDSGNDLKHWTKDEALKNSLESILLPEEKHLIYNAQYDSINIAINIFKQKILNQISEITSGALVGKTSIENAIKLSKELQK